MKFGVQIWCGLSEEMSVETFTPIWSHVYENKQKIADIQNLKFHNSLNIHNSVRPSLEVCMISWGVSLMCTFRGDLFNFPPLWSHVNESETKL